MNSENDINKKLDKIEKAVTGILKIMEKQVKDENERRINNEKQTEEAIEYCKKYREKMNETMFVIFQNSQGVEFI